MITTRKLMSTRTRFSVLDNVIFIESVKAVIQPCKTEKRYGARKIIKQKIVREFHTKELKVMSVHRLINKTDKLEPSRGRLEVANQGLLQLMKTKNIVEGMVAFAERCPVTSKSQRKIAAQLQVGRRSVKEMVTNLDLKASGFHNGTEILGHNAKYDVEQWFPNFFKSRPTFQNINFRVPHNSTCTSKYLEKSTVKKKHN